MKKSGIKTLDIRTHVGISCAFAYRGIHGILVANNDIELKALFVKMCGDDCGYDPQKNRDVTVMLDKKRNEREQTS